MTGRMVPLVSLLAYLLTLPSVVGQSPGRPPARAQMLIVEGLTVDAEGETVIPTKADPGTPLYYRRSSKSILTPAGSRVTAGTFATVRGTAEAACVPSGTRVEVHLTGLIPNALYRLWLITFKEPGFDLGPPPDMSNAIGEGALGPRDRSRNSFEASPAGEAQIILVHPPGPLSETLPEPPNANQPAGACLVTDAFEWHVVGAFQQPDQPSGPEIGPPLFFPETAVEQFVFIFRKDGHSTINQNSGKEDR